MKTLLFQIAALVLFLSPVTTVDAGTVSTGTVATTSEDVATYAIDPVHSEMSFRVRHLMGRVFGVFTDWEGTLTLNPRDLTTIGVDVTVQTASINTFNEQRNDHLRSDDFFATATYPTMTFQSSRLEQEGDEISLYGNLTIRGITKPVVLTGTYRGEGADPWGGQRIGFVATTTVNRHDFGVSFNQMVEGVGVIGDEVEISIAIEAVRQ